MERKLVGPFDSDEFEVEDFKVLEAYEMARRIGPVLDALDSLEITSESLDRFVIILPPLGCVRP
jgi:UDP-glucose:glycoprotein glucosyltransferase